MTAALNARPVGDSPPVSAEFLTAAAPAYLSSAQRATAPPDRFEQAVGYATTPLHGAASCLTPVDAGLRTTAGWLTADHLHQYARRRRHTIALPEPVWQALVTYHHEDDSWQLADNAERRGRLIWAEAVLRQLANWPRRRAHPNLDRRHPLPAVA